VRERAWLSQTLGTPIRAGRSWRALLLGALLTAVAVSVGAAWLVSTVVSTDAPGLSDPAQAAVELTEQRFAALASADAADLAQTVQEGSPAAASLDGQRQQLVAGELAYEGLQVRVVAAELVEREGAEATVVIDYTVSAHAIRKGDSVTSVPEYRQVVELRLSSADGGWRVTNARAAP
jgi:RNase P/RNase MRP subunit p29